MEALMAIDKQSDDLQWVALHGKMIAKALERPSRYDDIEGFSNESVQRLYEQTEIMAATTKRPAIIRFKRTRRKANG